MTYNLTSPPLLKEDLALKSAVRERQGDLENRAYLSKNPGYSLVSNMTNYSGTPI